MIDMNEAKRWSMERLRFEIDTLQREYDELKRELKEIEEDYYNETPDTNPSAFDRYGMRLADAAPIGLQSIPRQLECIRDQINALRDIVRAKL
jgi:hypothetical protein